MNSRDSRMDRRRYQDPNLKDKVIYINRVAKVVKGGKRFSFSVVAVVGDGQGKVGAGKGKAKEVPEAIRKAVERAKKNMVSVPLINTTIPYAVIGHFGAEEVVLKPAAEGTGIIAGGTVRAVMEVAGVQNVLSKSLGSGNPSNVVKATLEAFSQLKDPEESRKLRGVEPLSEDGT